MKTKEEKTKEEKIQEAQAKLAKEIEIIEAKDALRKMIEKTPLPPDGKISEHTCYAPFLYEVEVFNLQVALELAEKMNPVNLVRHMDGCLSFYPERNISEERLRGEIESIGPWYLVADQCGRQAPRNPLRFYVELKDGSLLEVRLKLKECFVRFDFRCIFDRYGGGRRMKDEVTGNWRDHFTRKDTFWSPETSPRRRVFHS